MSPLSLSSLKINKDVKHQSCSWLIKEDLKYFPLCLTWFWVSPSRTTTTGRNTVTRFFLLLLSVCVAEIEQTKPRLVLLWSQWVWLFKGSLFSVQLCEHWPPWARQNQSALYAHTCMNTNVACCCFIYCASLSLTATLKEQQPAIGSLSFEVNCVLWPTIPLTSAFDRLLWWCIWAEATVKCNWD